MDISGRRVTIMGLGHFGGGAAAARWLARQGAIVTVTDLASREALADSLAELEGVSIAQFHFGGHCEDDFRNTDLVVVSPAVKPANRFLQIAAAAGVPTTSEIELFLSECRGRVIGVTGSNGKSTTAAMTAAILQADGRRVWLGGNIGVSLLDQLDQIGPDDWAVLELSSFQLWYLSADARWPEVSVVTNCTPNHLNWHGTFEHYAAAKQRLLTEQAPDALAVLNPLDAEVSGWGHLVRGRQLPLVADREIPPLLVPGPHNRINARCAATAVAGIGCGADAVRRGLASFVALPQRLELVAVVSGRRFYNDSTATTPESTIAAMHSLEGGVWLLVGGSDKGSDFQALSDAIANQARGAAFFGAVREKLRNLVNIRRSDFPCVAIETMGEALDWCWQRSRSGDSILLSPACASHDQFQNFRQRGELFVELVGRLGERCDEAT